MTFDPQLFSTKLQELERQYGRMRRQIRACAQGDHAAVRSQLQRAKEEYARRGRALEDCVQTSRSPAVAQLAKAQLDGRSSMEALWQDGRLSRFLSSEGSSQTETRSEAAALYAEYAMDCAAQAMQYALIAALSAVDLQMRAAEETEDA